MSCTSNIIISRRYSSRRTCTQTCWSGFPLQFFFPLLPLAVGLPDAVKKAQRARAWCRHSQLVQGPEASRWAPASEQVPGDPTAPAGVKKKSLKGRFSTVISSPVPQRVWIKAHFRSLKCNKCAKKHHRAKAKCRENNGGRKGGEGEWGLGRCRKSREKEKEGNPTS